MKYQDILKENNIYATKLLKAIIAILNKAKGPLSVNEILFFLNKKAINVDKSTVYRQLTKLSTVEIVQESLFTDEIRRYCLLINKKPHHHFICQNCGYAEILPSEVCNSFAKEIDKYIIKNDNKIFIKIIEFEGLCKKCVKKMNK